MQKLKVKDKVKVVLGKDKGREGVVERVLVKENSVIIPEINMVKKHIKDPQGQRSGIYDIPKPLNVAKVMLICPNCKKPTRVGFQVVGESKVRVCKKCNKPIDKTTKTKSKK